MQQNYQQLKQRIGATIIELMDHGGTTPLDTYESLVETFPEVLISLPKQAIFDLCEEVQRSEVPEMSQRVQEMFREFNRTYFAGGLPDHEVRVVYDIDYWTGQRFHEGDMGIHQPELRRILIRITDRLPEMVSALLHMMAAAGGDINYDRRRLIVKGGVKIDHWGGEKVDHFLGS